MTALKLTKFLGTSPKQASELLPDTAAQIARNCKLYSGDLIPYPLPYVVANTGRSGPNRTLYALRDPDTQEPVWLSWDVPVTIATPATDESGEQRFYFSGDGAPKVSTYNLATSGSLPYPVTAYDLGLPLPDIKPVAVSTPFTPPTTSSFARDAGNNVTLVLASSHNLKNGALATISGFTYRTGTYSRTGTLITVTITGHNLVTGAEVLLEFTSGTATSNRYSVTVTGTDTFTCNDGASGATSGDVRWDIRDLNNTQEVTVINANTITYFSSGTQIGTTANTTGKVDLGGQIQSRTYLYTWYTPWQEESIGSEPSSALFIKEGQIVTVSNLPEEPPSGNNFIRGIRLYRTVSGTTDADYFRLVTLWFPVAIASVSRTANVSTIVFPHPHNMIEGDRFKFADCDLPSFNITGGEVLSIVDSHSITYAQTGADIVSTPLVNGTLYYDVSENPGTDTAVYWGDAGNFTFTDNFNYRSLLNILQSNEYDAPPSDLNGLTIIQNSILAGFSGNDLYLSEPNVFHAWPTKYKRSFDSTIVGLAQIGGNLLILTEMYPYILSGTDPAVMAQAKLSARYPCLNPQSIVETSFGVVYATHDGLAVYSPSIAAQLLTKAVHSSDTWNASLDPSTLVGVTYKDAYFASHSAGSIIFESNDKAGPTFVDSDFIFSAAWYDSLTNKLYLVNGNGDIYLWDDQTQPADTMTWKSKTLITKDFTNIGAARVIADYLPDEPTTVWNLTDTNWEDEEQEWDAEEPITFKLYVNKELYFTTTCSNSNVFRLPSGYKSDTFEVEVGGHIRVRAVHLGETPTSLRNV